MGAIADYFAAEHRSCDEVFATAEEAAQTGDLAGCQTRFQQFHAAMERHFQQEEQELFPAFEEASGMFMGPTRVMRLEHQQMRDTFDEMNNALASGNLEEFLGQAETLLILMQQHNIKEEQMLYPMCDRALGSAAGAVLEAVRNLPAG